MTGSMFNNSQQPGGSRGASDTSVDGGGGNSAGFVSWAFYPLATGGDPTASDPPQTGGALRPTPAIDPHQSTTHAPPLPTDVAALHCIINTLQTELRAIASLQAPQASLTPTTTTTTTTTTPLPSTAASGRGAASPEVFREMIKTNWHGRLGRTHMVDVDRLPAVVLSELDCFLRRKIHAVYPRGRDRSDPDADTIFAGLVTLGLRLEDRGTYADLPVVKDANVLRTLPTIKRMRNNAAWYTTHEKYGDYWRGSAVETLVELARYRGLFDDEGNLKEE